MKAQYDPETGKPIDKTYLECGLPQHFVECIREMERLWELEDAGEHDIMWGAQFGELSSYINSYEVNEIISHEQAQYLREKYLRMYGR